MVACNTSHTFMKNDTYCEWTYDKSICWPATKADSIVELPCPEMKGSDPTKMAIKYCEKNGHWQLNESWGNYTACFTDEILSLVEQMRNIPFEELQMKIDIAKVARILEVIGLTSSLIIFSLSFAIYYHFRSLRNERTRIHIHLFNAVTGSVLVKLILCIDQMIFGLHEILPTNKGIDGTSPLCEATYVMLEYFKSSHYMWMYIEALHLYNAVAVTATQMSFKKYYLFIGWCVPAVNVLIWVITMISKPRSHCWWGYNYNPSFWILEGPRVVILIINSIYLVIIIKVVFIKLRSNVSNEYEKIRKTTKATLVLLPLLGITNGVVHVEPKLTCPLWYFTLWTLAAYCLASFQGTVVGLLYCLLNKEVKEMVLGKITRSFNSGTNSPNDQKNSNRRNDYNMHSLENGVLP